MSFLKEKKNEWQGGDGEPGENNIVKKAEIRFSYTFLCSYMSPWVSA